MIHYLQPSASDWKDIAALHTLSWQRHYRGMMSNEYLDRDIIKERKKVWRQRFKTPNDKEFIVMAKDGEELCGFACTYAEDDVKYGALLDNLHVLAEHQGKGIGQQLMARTAEWLYARDPNQPLYLSVFEKNKGARTFYEKMGGEQFEKIWYTNQDNSQAYVLKYVWWDTRKLVRMLE